MGQGTSPSAPAVPATPAANGQATASNLTPQQAQAIAMLLSQMGKGGQSTAGMQGQAQRTLPQTSTVQGGSYFNPNRQ